MFTSNGAIKYTLLRDHLKSEGRLTERCALRVITEGTAQLFVSPNVIMVEAPVTICGDIHGQYYDLMKLFEVGGEPGKVNYLASGIGIYFTK